MALYYQISPPHQPGINCAPSPSQNFTGADGNCWLDTQVRIQYNNTGLSRIGHTETYGGPSDTGVKAWGWSNVTLQTSFGQSGVLQADVATQALRDFAAWRLPTNTTWQFMGLEIGIEGFQFNQLNVDFITAYPFLSLSAKPGNIGKTSTPCGWQYTGTTSTLNITSNEPRSTTFSISYIAPSNPHGATLTGPASLTVGAKASGTVTLTGSYPTLIGDNVWNVTVTSGIYGQSPQIYPIDVYYHHLNYCPINPK